MAMFPQKILVVGPFWIGDMVMMQSLFKLIKQHSPNTRIDVLASEWASALLSRMPEVEKAILAPFKRKKLQPSLRIKTALAIKKENYDQAIIIPTSLKAALIPFLAGIPIRTGWIGEFRYGILNDFKRLDKQKYSTQVERFCAVGWPKNTPLPDVLPKPALDVCTSSRQQLLEKLNLSEPNQPILILCPGAGATGWVSKQWPAPHFAEVASEALRKGWKVWILGSEMEREFASEIQKICHHQCIDLTGKTSITEAIDLLSYATIVIANDSGLTHIAAALGKKVLTIYGSTSPVYAPGLSNLAVKFSLNLPCQPCKQKICPLGHTQCLWNLKPADVLKEIA